MQKSILALLLLGFSLSSSFGQKTYENEWKEVESNVSKGLPQSALKIVDEIYLQSKTENNAPQFLKAAIYQVKLRSDYQEDFMETSIAQVKEELRTSQEPIRQVLHSIQAELYWRYYQGNRYKFLGRTQVFNPDTADIKTWDLRMLDNAITNNYLASLDDEDQLKKISLDPFDPILETEKGSKIFRPTLYDFLAHRALDYFMNEETDVTRPVPCFNFDKEKYFAPAGEFIKIYDFVVSSCANRKLQALSIFQDLLRFHINDKDAAALIDVDLERIKFVEQNSTLANHHELYLKALQDLQNSYSTNPHSAAVAYEIALEYQGRGAEYNPPRSDTNRWAIKSAKEICDKTISSFPGSEWAQNCSILLKQITDPVFTLSINYANVPDQPFLGSLSFKNLRSVYFRIIKINPDEDRNFRQSLTGENLISKYKSYAPVKVWTLNLPDEGDFQSHNTQIRIPGLPKGYYVILASDNQDFSIGNKSVAYLSCWITNISYISRISQTDSKMEVYAVDRDKGIPLKGVKAQAFVREYDYKSRSYTNKPVDSYISDENGYFSIPGPANASKSFYLQFTQGSDLFFSENYFYLYPPRPEEKSHVTTYFFTDRSIYRPGQTVYFKGIVLEKTGDKSVIKPDFSTVVTFYDANNQKVSEKAMTTNAFGSFNGTFTAPSGGLTGEMSIRSESGSMYFSVEEYKRPKFKVKIDSIQGSYRLNETVNVTGKAQNYSGSAVDQAEVSYRVVRTARFPVWRSWWDWFPSIPETEISNGMTVTDGDGAFRFSFTAIPDLQVDKKFAPVFNYAVYVDVTDPAGEVRSEETSITVGYKSLLLDVSIPENVSIRAPKAFRLTVTNLDRQPLAVTGMARVYPLDAPARLIRARKWERPDEFTMNREEFLKDFPNELYDNENDPETWKPGALLAEKSFNSVQDSTITFENPGNWAEGEYVIVLEATDTFGEKVEVKKYFSIYDPGKKQMESFKPFWHVMTRNSGEPGDTASLIAGTAEKNVRLLYEIENDGKVISSKWMPLSQEKIKIDIPILEEYRGNFFVNLVFVRGNRSYEVTEKITVPYTDKELKITTETFRDKLIPGQEEEWKLRITGMKGEKVAAELLASMYDASLDAFREHQWNFALYPYRGSAVGWDVQDAFTQAGSRMVSQKPQPDMVPFIQLYDQLNWFGFNYYGTPFPRLGGLQMRMNNAVPEMDGKAQGKTEEPAPAKAQEKTDTIKSEPVKAPEMPVRRNFSETAFFFPALMTDENGDVILKFIVPESLTAWKLMALAYTKDLKTGRLEKDIVTRKDLMVMTNAPRFFREGDQVLFSARVVSMADQKLQGQVQAEFFDALTMKPVDSLLGNKAAVRDFSVEKGKSGVYSWEISIPSGLEAIVCRVKATAGSTGDGEEIVVPVLPNRMLVTETLPLPVSGKGTENFKFSKLARSSESSTIRNYRLTLEFTSNPAWYAVQALPYLAENTRESSDGIFSRYYANSLASFIANSNPKIKQVFENWKNLSPDALLSNLEKNQDLKAVILAETPWVMEARNETERKKNIALLFDLNRMASEQQTALKMLGQMQSPNGGWPWFEGMPDNRYITQLIMTGLGRLQYLKVIDLKKDQVTMNMIRRAFSYLDDRIKEDYAEILAHDKDKSNENHLRTEQIQYLYAFSYLKDLVQVSAGSQEAFDYFKGQAAKYWTDQNKYMQGMIALALNRLEVPAVPASIMASLKETALTSDELGMYWREPEGYYWQEAPVERQAMLIEAFSEVANDQAAVDQMKTWLLKQKQTQDWKTSRATADAVYALLLKGNDLLTTQLVEVSMGGEKIDPLNLDGVQLQAGTGYFQVSKQGSEITPAMANIKVVKKDEGIAWGAVYWQYFENLDKITPAQTPLNLERDLYTERNTPSGPVLDPVFDNTILKTGEKLKVRITIRVDRDMEYVHMKDMRAAAFEPTEALSGYRYQDGLGYYESIRDASVNFYFDYLHKGTYVFEYSLNITQKGEFSNGITSIQCLYAPEFSAHSQGLRVKVE